MRLLLLLLLHFFLPLALYAQQTGFSIHALGKGKDWLANTIGEAVASDGIGNVYWGGTFYDTLILKNTILKNEGGLNNIFITRVDSSGNIIWINQEGGKSGNITLQSIVVDVEGNLLATGTYSGRVYFNNGKDSLNSGGKISTFLAKYSCNGKLLKLIKVGESNGVGPHYLDIYSKSIATDNDANIFISGIYHDEVDFFGIILPARQAASNVFVLKLDKNFNLQWARQLERNDDPGIRIPLNCDNAGRLYVVCEKGTIASYDTNGLIIWRKDFTEPLIHLMSVHSDHKENLIIGGYYSTNPRKMFINRYNKEGNLLMEKFFEKDAIPNGIKIDNEENIIIGGIFVTDTHFDNFYLPGEPNKPQIFVIKCDSMGVVKWVKDYRGTGIIGAKEIDIDKLGNIIITGWFTETANFGDSIHTVQGYFTTHNGFLLQVKDKGVIETSFKKNEIDSYRRIRIYPNPTLNNFTIHYQSKQTSFINLKVRSLTGEIIYEITEPSSSGTFQKEIDIGKHAPGIYFVDLVTDKERLVRKIVINH